VHDELQASVHGDPAEGPQEVPAHPEDEALADGHAPAHEDGDRVRHSVWQHITPGKAAVTEAEAVAQAQVVAAAAAPPRKLLKRRFGGTSGSNPAVTAAGEREAATPTRFDFVDDVNEAPGPAASPDAVKAAAVPAIDAGDGAASAPTSSSSRSSSSSSSGAAMTPPSSPVTDSDSVDTAAPPCALGASRSGPAAVDHDDDEEEEELAEDSPLSQASFFQAPSPAAEGEVAAPQPAPGTGAVSGVQTDLRTDIEDVPAPPTASVHAAPSAAALPRSIIKWPRPDSAARHDADDGNNSSSSGDGDGDGEDERPRKRVCFAPDCKTEDRTAPRRSLRRRKRQPADAGPYDDGDGEDDAAADAADAPYAKRLCLLDISLDPLPVADTGADAAAAAAADAAVPPPCAGGEEGTIAAAGASLGASLGAAVGSIADGRGSSRSSGGVAGASHPPMDVDVDVHVHVSGAVAEPDVEPREEETGPAAGHDADDDGVEWVVPDDGRTGGGGEVATAAAAAAAVVGMGVGVDEDEEGFDVFFEDTALTPMLPGPCPAYSVRAEPFEPIHSGSGSSSSSGGRGSAGKSKSPRTVAAAASTDEYDIFETPEKVRPSGTS